MLAAEALMESVETRTIMAHLEMVQLSFVLAYSYVDRRSKCGNKYLLVQEAFPLPPLQQTGNTSFQSELNWRPSSSSEQILETSNTLELIWTVLSTALLCRIYRYTTVVVKLTDNSMLFFLEASLSSRSAIRLCVTITRLKDEDHTKL